jgi:hypothetical protein
MNPKWRRRAALALVVVSLVGWPASCLTVAKDEPQFVLGLSWLAITLTAADILATSDVRTKQEGE